jgi:hypothetical protein
LAQAGLDGREFDAPDLADQPAVFAIQQVRGEHARNHRRRARIHRVQRVDQRKVLLVEHPAHDAKRLRRCHAQPVHRALLDARLHEFFVELGTRAMHDDRRQAHTLQERQ